VQSLAQTAFIIILILVALNQLGVETASLITLVGAAGLALALSLQGLLTNFTSGLLLISYRLFRVGDVIEVSGMTGRVSEMLPFHVVLVTSDNQRIILPNSMLTSGAVRNHSALPHRRMQWTLAIKPQDDLAAAKEALRTCVASRPGVLAEPAPQVHVHDWSDDKRLLTVSAWTTPENYDAVQQGTLEVLGKCLEDLRQRAAAAT
jgi:small conductance mechanosensitive channel